MMYEARSISKTYTRRATQWFKKPSSIKAVDNASLSLRKGEIAALIGESGSGKSTLGRILARLEVPDSGTLLFAGKEISAGNRADKQVFRQKVQLVFQDPYDSLDPRYSVYRTVEEPLLSLGLSAADRRAQVARTLERVRLTPSERYIDAMPHELSGGQRQRVAIVRTLISDPSVLIADPQHAYTRQLISATPTLPYRFAEHMPGLATERIGRAG
jgi:peptide/nickel transport system ATP-binding protein